jgi:MFS family permease
MLDTPALERNLRRYQAFAALSFAPIMIPVIVLFWQQNGLDLFEIFLLQAVFAVAIVLLEVPTGLVADRVGKRTSLVWGMAIATLGMVAYALGTSFVTFAIAELLLALGLSFWSGAGSALLYDTLSALGREDDFRRIEGRTRAIQMVWFAACNLLGGFIGAYSLRATVWLSCIGPLLGLLLALSLREVRPPQPASSLRTGVQAYRELISQSLRFVLRHRLVRWQIIFLGVLMGSMQWLLWLYQPYMEWCGLPVWSFGIAFTIFNLFAALMSHQADRFDRLLGRTGTIAALMALQIAPLVLMPFLVGSLSFLFVLGHQAVRGLASPIVSARILRYTYADKRATVLSISALGGRLFFAITAPLIGRIAEHTSMAGSLLIQAGVLTLVLGALLIAYVRIPAKYFRVKDSVIEHQ